MKDVPRVTNCDHLTLEELKAICSAVHKDIMFGASEEVLDAEQEELFEEYKYYSEALEARLAQSNEKA